MGHVRHSKKKIPFDDAHARPVSGQAKVVPHRLADLVDLKSARAENADVATDVWRQARRMRAEWRRERYSRLTTA